MPIKHSNAASQATPKMVMDEIHNNDAVSNDWKEGRNAEDAKSSLSDALEEAFSSAAQHNHSKDSLSEALDAIVEDADNGKEQETKAEEKDPVVDEDSPVSEDKKNKDADKDSPSAPKLADEPDEDGLVYVSMTFKIDPTKYRSANYNPLSTLSKDAAKIGKNKPNAVNKDDEPTPSEEEIAAEEADAKSEDLLESKDNTKKGAREALDSASDDDVVSSQPKPSYPCALPECGYNGGKQDLSKTAMDVRPRPTRQTCQTTFAQCRAENPLFCRFHGPKLLEADIRGTMRALGIRGQVLVTKVPNTDNTFKVTVGCRPSDKEQAKSALRWYSEQMGVTGITNTSDINDIGANGGIGREFQMDLLRADRAPARSGKEAVANLARNRAVEEGRTMPVVGEDRPRRQRRQSQETTERTEGNSQEAQQPRQEQAATQGVSQEQAAQHQQPQTDARQHGNIHTCPTDEEMLAFVDSLTERIGAEYLDDATRIVKSAMRGVTDIGTFGPSEILGEIGLTDPVARYIQLAPIEQRRKDWEDNHPELFRDSRESRPTDSEIDEAVNEASRNWIGRGTPPKEVVRERLLRVVDGALDENWGDVIGSLSPGNPVRMFLIGTNQEQRRRFSGLSGTDSAARDGGGSEATPPQHPQTQQRQGQLQQGDDNNQQGQIEHLDGGVKARFSPSERQAIEREMGRAMRIASERPDDIEARSYAHTLSHLLGSRDSAVGRRNHALAGIRDNITKAELLEKAENRLRSSAHHHEKYHGAERAIRKIAELSGIENLEVEGDRIWIEGHGNGGGDANRRQEANEQERQAPQPNQQQGNGQAEIRQPTADEMAVARDLLSSDRRMNAVSSTELNIALNRAVAGERPVYVVGEPEFLEILPQDNAVRRFLENTTPEQRRAIAGAARDEVDAYEPIPQGNEETPQSAAPANNPPRMPTSEEMDSVAAELADRRGWPLSSVRSTIEGIVRGNISAHDYRNEILTIPNDNPVRVYIDHLDAVARAQAEEAERQSQEEDDANQTREISDISSEEALRRVVPARKAATREEVARAREDNRIYWQRGADGLSEPTKHDAMNGVIAANTTGLSQEVFDADHAVQREAMPNCRTFRGGRAYGGEVLSSQTTRHGCNCWKTVAAALLRLRGFKVKARTQIEASPVFANTPARDGGQKITFKTSQEAMLKAYERVNEDSRLKAFKHINRILDGNDGSDGSQPTLPYPDGTFISTWDGGHCTGAVLYKGKLFHINPFYGNGYSETSVESVVNSMCNASGATYRYEILGAMRRYREDKASARARGQRYQLDPDSIDKVMVLHFLSKQKEMKRTNRNVTDNDVAEACSRDELWRNINGSFVIRPDEPLIPELFGLAKPSTT